MPILSREENYRMAKLSYNIMKDYEASFRYMEDLINSVRGELSPTERKLFLCSGDWLIDIHMTRIKKLSAMLLEPNNAAVVDYHTRLVFEVKMICYRYLAVLQRVIIVTTDLLSLVLYYWARGDCYRSIVETMNDDNSDLQSYTYQAIEAYTRAWDEARILVRSDPREAKELALLAHRLVLFCCDDVVKQYMEARRIALQTLSDIRPTLSDVRPRNIFSLVMKIKSYMECSETRHELNLLIGLCNSKLNQHEL